ncbi:MAG: hypothetical protein JSV91_08310 [Phycisphaerales bacterium]|nr:MAG: hypothetical protein JSV91_08310 [Phycisphaerales bacterium]
MRQYLGINGPAGWSLAAIALAIIVLGLQVPALLGAALSFGRGDDEAARKLQDYVADHSSLMDTYRERFLGRSLFDTPRPLLPQRPRVERPPVEEGPPPPPPAPPAEPPPSAFAIFGDEVWFKPMSAEEGILRIRVAEEKQGLKVLSITSPISATVSYQGREHELILFEDWPDGTGDIFANPAVLAATIPGQIELPEEEKSPPEGTGEAAGASQETDKPPADPAASPQEDDEKEVVDDDPEKDDGQEEDGPDIPPDEPGSQSKGEPPGG